MLVSVVDAFCLLLRAAYVQTPLPDGTQVLTRDGVHSRRGKCVAMAVYMKVLYANECVHILIRAAYVVNLLDYT